jgi:hypothetical protein
LQDQGTAQQDRMALQTLQNSGSMNLLQQRDQSDMYQQVLRDSMARGYGAPPTSAAGVEAQYGGGMQTPQLNAYEASQVGQPGSELAGPPQEGVPLPAVSPAMTAEYQDALKQEMQMRYQKRAMDLNPNMPPEERASAISAMAPYLQRATQITRRYPEQKPPTPTELAQQGAIPGTMNTIIPNGKGGYSNFKMTPVEDTAITQKRATIPGPDGSLREVGTGAYEWTTIDGTPVITDVDQNGNTSTRPISGADSKNDFKGRLKQIEGARKELEKERDSKLGMVNSEGKALHLTLPDVTDQEVLDRVRKNKALADQLDAPPPVEKPAVQGKTRSAVDLVTGPPMTREQAESGTVENLGQEIEAMMNQYGSVEKMNPDKRARFLGLVQLYRASGGG